MYRSVTHIGGNPCAEEVREEEEAGPLVWGLAIDDGLQLLLRVGDGIGPHVSV